MPQISIESWQGTNEHRCAFGELNREWLEEFFWIEPIDEAMLADPQGYIIDKGGDILFARVDGELLGTIALFKLEEEGIYELSKMGVTKRSRGFGLGRKLGEALIDLARKRGVKKLYIASNRKLDRAMALYKNLGFIEMVECTDTRYGRCDITLELILTSPERGEVEARSAEGGGDASSTASRLAPLATLPPNGGGEKPDPTRYGDWELKGKCVDF